MENRSRMVDMQMKRIVSRYELGDLLGRGAYSEVFKAKHLDTGNPYAVKVINNKVLADNEKVKECINNQLSTHQILQQCRHIVRFHELLQTKNNCYFVYEFCEGGTLHDLMKKEGPLEQKKAISVFLELVAGLRVLRKYNIMHRDLKPENVLIKEGVFKLADFGFCKELPVQMMTRTMLGSPLYMAPQILRGEAYSVNADIWSMGVIFYEMLTGNCPYASNSIASLISAIEEKPLQFSSKIKNPNIKGFITRCLQKDCKVRMSWQQFFEETSHLSQNSSEILNLSNRSFTPVARSVSREHRLHTTLAFDEMSKRSTTPVKSPSEVKSKFEVFKENYHKASPSDVKIDHQIFVSHDNMQSKSQRSRSAAKHDPKDRNKDQKLNFNELMIQHQRCLSALKACLQILESRNKKQVVSTGAVLKGIHKVLERIYSKINIDDIEMLPVLSMVKYEMIQVEKMQGEVQKWTGSTAQQPDSATLPVSLVEPWALLSSYS